MFRPVTREQNRLRLALDGPAGAGKTFTALRLAFALAGPNGRVAVIDTEHHTASKYSGLDPDGIIWKWDGCDLENFAPSVYEAVIKYAGDQGYDILVIDSLSHAWTGIGGALEQVDRSSDQNKFTAWRNVTPQHNQMVEAILASPCHIIATLRSKMEYVLEENEKGKKVPRKVGLKPIQREGIEYEFDILGDLDLAHTMVISKSRCPALDGKVYSRPDASIIPVIKEWLYSGVARGQVIPPLAAPAGPPAPRLAPPPPPAPPATLTTQGGHKPPPEPPPAAGPAPIPAPVLPPPRSPGVRVKGRETRKADEFQISAIHKLFAKLQFSPEKQKEILSKVGALSTADLLWSIAEQLITKLHLKVTEEQAKEVF